MLVHLASVVCPEQQMEVVLALVLTSDFVLGSVVIDLLSPSRLAPDDYASPSVASGVLPLLASFLPSGVETIDQFREH